MLANHLKWENNDDYTTPIDAWETILNFIPKTEKLWLPFYYNGEAEYKVHNLGYEIEHYQLDFFEYDLPDHLVIDNPPYSIKKQVISHLKKRNKPFALLLPLHTLERNYIHGDKELQVLIKKGKFNFFSKSKCSPPYKACWFCWGLQSYLKTEDQLIFI